MAPRDVVARAIFKIMKERNLPNVWLDISPIGLDKFSRRFPTIYQKLEELNLCIKGCKIPVRPAAHYFMGGIKIDLYGRTTLKNLFAAGEVSCSGLHGANRLASNSLLESLVFAKLVGDNGRYYKDKSIKEINFIEKKSMNNSITEDVKDEIKERMEQNAGIVRTKEELEENIKFFKELWQNYQSLDDNKLENVELKSLIINGYLISYFAWRRKESRGAHYREDYPYLNDIEWKKHQHYSLTNNEEYLWIK